ncbi:hypothetical protein [Nocardioides speluncae]|uniref:hypothetical protein n=1 Tax=Nocardioides speluncae TaxID=2670337 RepID=UPI000D685882|nr:hypothetical protein [Nocardioides speluncae]
MRISALIAVPMALVGLAVPASAEDPGLTVTWPTTTEVEVPTTSYTITVADEAAEPQGTLYAEWQGERQEIPHAGNYAMQFAKGGVGSIKVIRCVPADPEPVCTDTGVTSPELTVWKQASVTLSDVGGVVRPGTRTAGIRLDYVPSTPVQVTWSVWTAGGVAKAAGGATFVPNGEGYGEFSYPVPNLANGWYYVQASVEFDMAPFGPFKGASDNVVAFYLDATAPRLSLGLSASSFYPATDGYRDQLSIRAATNEQVKQSLTVLNSSGAVVRTLGSGRLGFRDSGASVVKTWNGRDSQARLVRGGTYTIRFEGTDRVGRKTTTSKEVFVSGKRLQRVTWKRTFAAARTIVRNGAFVQACSTLRKPSLRGWSGSLGYYSRTKCNRNNADIVATNNGVYVPKAFQNRYGTYQVSFYGGGARGARSKYIVMGYLNNKGDFTHRIQGGAAVRTYAGKVASAGNFVRAKTTKPYVLWTAGLTDGSRYDVKSFTVRLTYTVLR